MTIDRAQVLLHRLDTELPIPAYAKEGDAGADLSLVSDVTLAPGQRIVVGTGMAIALPVGYVGLIHPRSGLAARHGITIVNAPGTIDAGYRGEIKICLLNTDNENAVTLRRGDRIAQLVVQRYTHIDFIEVDQLPSSERGEQGYGSTDIPISGQDETTQHKEH